MKLSTAPAIEQSDEHSRQLQHEGRTYVLECMERGLALRQRFYASIAKSGGMQSRWRVVQPPGNDAPLARRARVSPDVVAES